MKKLTLLFFIILSACGQKKIVKTPLVKSSEVFFAFAAEKIPAKYDQILRDNLAFLKSHPDSVIVIEGHTDRVGSDRFNLDLGDRRARSIKAFFISQGVRPEQVVVVSYGEEKPKDMKHLSVNRRAVIKDVAQ